MCFCTFLVLILLYKSKFKEMSVFISFEGVEMHSINLSFITLGSISMTTLYKLILFYKSCMPCCIGLSASNSPREDKWHLVITLSIAWNSCKCLLQVSSMVFLAWCMKISSLLGPLLCSQFPFFLLFASLYGHTSIHNIWVPC